MSILNELLSMLNESDDGAKEVEITEFSGTSIPHSCWPSGLTYKGTNVFKVVYDGKGEDDVVRAVSRRIKSRYDSLTDIQECYLGYNKAKDEFLLGFDGWGVDKDDGYGDDEDDDGGEEEFNCAPYAKFKLVDGTFKLSDIGQDYGHGEQPWYSKSYRGSSSACDIAEKNGYIHIRLD